MMDSLPKLDPREEHFSIPGPHEGLSLFLRFLPAARTEFQPRRALWRESIDFLRAKMSRRSLPEISEKGKDPCFP